MSRFFSQRLSSLVPYTPGEQPQDMQYIKLNTNESPFPPAPKVRQVLEERAELLRLYSDPECKVVRKETSRVFGVPEDWIIMNNGSDETLNFAFMAFADDSHPLVFPDITYGFYPVFADLNHIPYTEIPLTEDYEIRPEEYYGIGKTICLANPNAQTGVALPAAAIEEIVKRNPDNMVIIDEAYVDFGGESVVPLVKKYDNLLVIGTFSKSRSFAGGRLGFGIGRPELIADLNTIRYSTNPYNINSLTEYAGAAILKENDYYMNNCKKIMANRSYASDALRALGFRVLPSCSNFILAGDGPVDGETLYQKLKAMGVLVRHFDKERIRNYCRITVGTREQMDILLDKVKTILAEV